MAAITISSPGGAQTNPTNTKLPYNKNGTFKDSMLYQDTRSILSTTYNVDSVAGPQGLFIDNESSRYYFGDNDGAISGAHLDIDSSDGSFNCYAPFFVVNAQNEIQLNGALTSASAGGNAGLHLKLTINGTKYKIQLLNG